MDPKAKKILFSTYWCAQGWKPESQRMTTPADFAYAKQAGVMFDPFTLSHDEAVARLVAVAARVREVDLAAAFLASLSVRMPHWRSALASHAVARALPAHGFVSYDAKNHSPMPYVCAVCRQHGMHGVREYVNTDLNVLNFERLKWGGIRHTQIVYALLDLERFEAEEHSAPSEEDVALLEGIFQIIESSQPKDNARTLEKRLNAAKILPSSKGERDVMLEILALAGVLKAADHSRHAGGDWNEAGYWRGQDGLSSEGVRVLFSRWLG